MRELALQEAAVVKGVGDVWVRCCSAVAAVEAVKHATPA